MTATIPLRSARYWFERGEALEATDPAGAIDAYRNGLAVQPDDAFVLINLGRMYANADQWGPTLAQELFRRAAELDPKDATALYNLGVIAQDAGRGEEAAELYRRALALDPVLAEAHYNIAGVLDRSDKLSDKQAALRHLHEYRRLAPEGVR